MYFQHHPETKKYLCRAAESLKVIPAHSYFASPSQGGMCSAGGIVALAIPPRLLPLTRLSLYMTLVRLREPTACRQVVHTQSEVECILCSNGRVNPKESEEVKAEYDFVTVLGPTPSWSAGW